MKFQPDTTEGANLVTRHEPGRVWVGSTAFQHSVLVPWAGQVLPWPAASVADLTPAHFASIAAMQPELVIFGSGERLRFPAPALLQALMQARIGIESMDTAAACRTYNVLVSERRMVVAALLLGSSPPASGPAETL